MALMWAGEWGVVGRFEWGALVGFVISVGLWVASHGYGGRVRLSGS